MMNPKFKKLWLEALRSDDYEQGEGDLFKSMILDDYKQDANGNKVTQFNTVEPCYCALGVLMAVMGYDPFATKPNAVSPDVDDRTYETLLLEAGLTYEDEEQLIIMNDGEHRDFEEIADWIEVML